jgi:membrane fusion protein
MTANLAASAARPAAAGNAPLFRPESLANKQASLLGTIRIAQPISHTVWAIGAGVIVLAIAAFLAFGQVTQRAAVTGLLTPSAGLARLVAPASGVLERADVTDGQTVTTGMALFVISTERQSGAGATQAAVATELAARRLLAQQEVRRVEERFDGRVRTVQERLAALDREAAQMLREEELAASRVQLAAKQTQRIETLAQSGFVSEGQLQTKQDEMLASRQQLAAFEHSRASLGKERTALQSQLREIAQQRSTEQADAARTLALLNQESAENEARRSIIITAPKNGTLTGLTAQIGQFVQAGTPLGQIVPQMNSGTAAHQQDKQDKNGADLQAHFYVPTRQAGFIEPGQAVRLRYAAYPYQKFGQHRGIVIAVDKTPYAPQELQASVMAALQSGTASHANTEAAYRVTVSLERQTIQAYGKPQPLKPGMVLEADIVQRTSKVYEWMLEPLRSVSARGV